MVHRVFEYKSINWHNAELDEVGLYIDGDRWFITEKGPYGENKFDLPEFEAGYGLVNAIDQLGLNVLTFTSHRTIEFQIDSEFVPIVMPLFNFSASSNGASSGIKDLHKPNWEVYGKYVLKYSAYEDYKISVNGKPWVVCLGRENFFVSRIAIPVNTESEDLLSFIEASWQLVEGVASHRQAWGSDVGVIDLDTDGWIYVSRDTSPMYLPVYELIRAESSADAIAIWLEQSEDRRINIDSDGSRVDELKILDNFKILCDESRSEYQTTHMEIMGEKVILDYSSKVSLAISEGEFYVLALRLQHQSEHLNSAEKIIDSVELSRGDETVFYKSQTDSTWLAAGDVAEIHANLLERLTYFWDSLGELFEMGYFVTVRLKEASALEINEYLNTFFSPFTKLNHLRWEVVAADGTKLNWQFPNYFDERQV